MTILAPTPTEDPTAAALLAELLPHAQALSAEEVIGWYGPVALTGSNVRTGTANVYAERTTIDTEVRSERAWAAAAQAVSLATVTVYAFALADRAVAVSHALPYDQHRSQVGEDRRDMLAALEVLRAQAKVSAAQIVAIRSGKGPEDSASDVLTMCPLLRQHDAAGALMPTPRVDAAELLAQGLKDRLRPGGRLGDRGKKGEAADAADLRDRFFTLLLRAYTEVRRLGMWRWDEEVDAHVPPIHKRRLPAG